MARARNLRALSLAGILLAGCAPSTEPEPYARTFDERRAPLSATGRLSFTVVDESGDPVRGHQLYVNHFLGGFAGDWEWCGTGSPNVSQYCVRTRPDAAGRVDLELAADWELREDTRDASSTLWIADDLEAPNLGAVVVISCLDGSGPNELGEIVLRPRRLLAAGQVKVDDSWPAPLERYKPLVWLQVPMAEPLKPHGAWRIDDPRAFLACPLERQEPSAHDGYAFRFEGWFPGEQVVLTLGPGAFGRLHFEEPMPLGSTDVILSLPDGYDPRTQADR